MLTRLMSLSVAAALATIALKTVAWRLTGSVGLLSDAVESSVNLVAAVAGLVLVRWAGSPPDRGHPYGHGKAEYFSAGLEGGLILVAAAMIAWSAVQRLLEPQPLHAVGPGLAIAAVAALLNLAVGLVMVHEGRRLRSITVEADGHHLLADVWTSVGVIVGVGAVGVTGWLRLDPVIALVVDANVVATGVTLLRRASAGLMDATLPQSQIDALDQALEPYREQGIGFHAIRTRQAGRQAFVSLHVLVPGDWTVREGHRLLERLERDIRAAVPGAVVSTHLEPADDSASTQDAP